MLILVTANNFLQLFVGWEGVGLSSYLLINFWFTRIQANKAAIKAMLVNRVGDFALLLAIFTIYFIFNTLDFDTIFALVPLSQNYTILIGSFKIFIVDLICFLLFICARINSKFSRGCGVVVSTSEHHAKCHGFESYIQKII
jgi:NADH:ubiquinone oxidoreductase subunit 5 (subunit L)/multisubunit Na+/H+ antiporter MnhA subunit